jgi:hypothetical protein
VTLFHTETMHAIARVQERATERAGLDRTATACAEKLVRAWDAHRGAFPVGTVAVVSGLALTTVGALLLGVGAWQLVERSAKDARLARLERDYQAAPDDDLADQAVVTREALLFHTTGAVIGFVAAGACMLAGGALLLAGATGVIE